MTRDKVSGDALFILKSIKENVRTGRSNKLADVKQGLENSVSLEFDSYFFFLRKFHYIAMDREAQLKLTDLGERAVEGEGAEKFTGEVAEFFADQITAEGESGHVDIGSQTLLESPRPPPTATDLLLQETPMPPPPPPPSRAGGRKPTGEEPSGSLPAQAPFSPGTRSRSPQR